MISHSYLTDQINKAMSDVGEANINLVVDLCLDRVRITLTNKTSTNADIRTCLRTVAICDQVLNVQRAYAVYKEFISL